MRAPLPTMRTGPTGAYGASRGGGRRHWGYDIVGKPGDVVVAPEDLTILHVANDDTTSPLGGYGPGAILARGASGAYHVIGHMDPTTWQVGDRVSEGDPIGVVGRLNHVHWEIRTVELPPRGAARGPLTLDPVLVLKYAPQGVLPPPGALSGSSELALLLLIAVVLTEWQ